MTVRGRARGADPVAILAAGAVTPIGTDLDTFWSALVEGRDGISAIERFRVDDLRVGCGGEIKRVPAIDGGGRIDCRASQLLLAAADDLRRRGRIDAEPARLAVVVGTALGGVEELERALDKDGRPRRAGAALYDSPGRALARRLGARGPLLTVSTACASGATALGVGADLLRADRADLVVAGGFDILCRFVMRGFDALRSLTRERVRPFDRRRSGLLLGEGAALVLMAREADARGPRLGRLLGHASTSDGAHIAAPHPEGRGLLTAVRGALAQAAIDPADVDLVSAHGTATPLNDRIETLAIKEVFGERARRIPVSGTKGMHAHALGASGAVEAAIASLSIHKGWVPSTTNLREPDPECDLDYVPGAGRRATVRTVLSNSFGFGGTNACLVFSGVS